MKKLILPLVLLAALVILLNTRFGVFIVFDVVGDLFDDSDGFVARPLSIASKGHLTGTQVPLPAAIEQPSGIAVTDTMRLISTDQAELFALSPSFKEVLASQDFIGGPLLFKQGSVETIAVSPLSSTELSIAGELGAIQHWRRGADGWSQFSESAPTGAMDAEFTGMTRVGDEHWLVADGGLDIYVLERDLWLPVPGDPGDLLASGIAFDGKRLWLVVENIPSIIALDPVSLDILEAHTIDAPEPSDIAVHQGFAYVTVDHNYFDLKPPLYRYELPN